MSWLVLVLGLLALLAFVPLSLELVVQSHGRLRVTAKPRWGWLPLGTIQAGGASTRTNVKKAAPARRQHARGAPQLAKLRALLTSEDFLASLGRWLGRLLRLLGPSDVRVRLRLGTGDPCETAQVWGTVSALSCILFRECTAELDLEPDFVEEVFDLDAQATIHLVPALLILTLLAYLLSPPPWRALRAYALA